MVASYPGDGEGDRPVGAPGTEIRFGAGQRACGPQRE